MAAARIARLAGALAVVAAALATGSAAHAEAAASIEPRRWRLLADTLIGVRANQAGLVDVGYRLALAAGLLTPPVDVSLALDRQVGGDDQVTNREGAAAACREWVGSVRVGRRVALAPALALSAAVGPALAHTRLRSASSEVSRASFALDGTAALVWRSGPVAASLALGATAVPSTATLMLDGARFVVPARLESWAGLGIGLVL